jgi:pseudouridine-5'-phosphate glycosidase
MEAVITRAIAQANQEGVKGKDLTPYLLAHIKDMTHGESFASNLQLAYNNARAASRIAVALAGLEK